MNKEKSSFIIYLLTILLLYFYGMMHGAGAYVLTGGDLLGVIAGFFIVANMVFIYVIGRILIKREDFK